jgi:hypothetical protein
MSLSAATRKLISQRAMERSDKVRKLLGLPPLTEMEREKKRLKNQRYQDSLRNKKGAPRNEHSPFEEPRRKTRSH